MKIKDLPPPPDKPTPYECCGSGCLPCIFEYYYEQLEAWEQKHGMSRAEYQRQKELLITAKD